MSAEPFGELGFNLGLGEFFILAFFALLAIAGVVLFIAALVSVVKNPDLEPTPKALWVLICLLVPFLGAVIWFLFGRKQARENSGQYR